MDQKVFKKTNNKCIFYFSLKDFAQWTQVAPVKFELIKT